MSKQLSHYVITDDAAQYGIAHIDAASRKEAASIFVDENDMVNDLDVGYGSLRVGVVLESDIVYFQVEATNAVSVTQE